MTSSRANQLAKRYKLPAEVVQMWLDGPYSAREVERAINVGRDRRADPGDVLAMLGAGLDWQEIDSALAAVPDDDNLDADAFDG